MRLNLTSSFLLVVLGLAACAEEPADDDRSEPSGPIVAVDSQSCGGIPDGSSEDRVFYEAATVPYGEACEPRYQSCTCTEGQWLCQGPLTETSCEVLCPHNATRVGGTNDAPVCECLPDYVMDGIDCVPACPANSYWDATSQLCTCEPDHFVNAQGTACVHGDQLCPEHSHYQPEPDGELHCQCDPGYVVNWDRDACVLPGEECPAGRPKVVINNVVIICCPADAVGASYSSNSGASCVCPEGQTYDANANECT